jgi:hypothetical protein
MNFLSTSTSTLPQSRKIPNYTIDQETLEHLKQTSPLHYFVAIACLKDGRWHLKDTFYEGDH